MSVVAFSVEFYVGGEADPGLRRLSVAFERAGAEVAQVSKHILPRLSTALEEAAAAQFDGEGVGPSGRWKQLSAKYAQWKARVFPGMPILQRTGALRDGLTNSSSATAIRSISGDSLTYGASVDYGSLHQRGTSKMPARPPIDLGPDFEDAMVALAKAGIRDAIREGGEGLLEYEGDTFEGQAVLRTARGGAFVMRGGQKVYLRRRADGSTVTRTFGGGA